MVIVGIISNMSRTDWLSIIAIVVSILSIMYTWNNDKRINQHSEINIRASVMLFLNLTLDKEINICKEGCYLEIGLKNIGNGPATDIKIMPVGIQDNSRQFIMVNNKKLYGIQKDLNTTSVMKENEVNFVLFISNDELERVYPYSDESKYKKAKINFSIGYFDLLGNEYKQNDYYILLYFNEDNCTFHYKKFVSGRMELVSSKINEKVRIKHML